MANTNHTTPQNQTQFISTDISDTLNIKYSQLEAIIDILSVALDEKCEPVFKKRTLRDSIWMVEEVVTDIKCLLKKMGHLS